LTSTLPGWAGCASAMPGSGKRCAGSALACAVHQRGRARMHGANQTADAASVCDTVLPVCGCLQASSACGLHSPAPGLGHAAASGWERARGRQPAASGRARWAGGGTGKRRHARWQRQPVHAAVDRQHRSAQLAVGRGWRRSSAWGSGAGGCKAGRRRWPWWRRGSWGRQGAMAAEHMPAGAGCQCGAHTQPPAGATLAV
jgi:hypothetical protein